MESSPRGCDRLRTKLYPGNPGYLCPGKTRGGDMRGLGDSAVQEEWSEAA